MPQGMVKDPANVVLKQEPWTRVEVVGGADGRVVRKTYRTSRLRRWQSFGVPSRAEREYTNLERAWRAGVPCLEPLHWDAQRAWGCVRLSLLDTRHEPGAEPVPRVLERAGGRERARWVAEMGTLLRQVHDAGIIWGTSYPRNILVAGDRLVVCDVPSALCFDGSTVQRAGARADVYDLAFSPSRCRQFSRVERWRLVRAYAGSRDAARKLWQGLAGRSRRRNQAIKKLLAVGPTYIRPFFSGLLGRRR